MPEELRPRQVLYITLLLALAAGLVRFYRLDDSVHPDSLLWYPRCQRFWAALSSGRFSGTNQAPHPGVMLMWLTGLVMKLNGTLSGSINPAGLYALKLPGALLGTLAASLTFPLLQACLGKAHWRAALIVAALLASEPYLLEQSRMAHLDMLGLGFAWLGLLVAMLAYERESLGMALGAGALFGAACLTKLSLAPLPVTLMTILIGTSLLSRLRDKRGLKVAGLATVAALLTCFILWPALWTAPRTTVLSVLSQTQKLARHGHGHTIDGERTQDPGVGFYVNWVLGVTPYETVLLALTGAAALWFLPKLRKHYLWLSVSLLPYLVLIAITPKKLTRYALPAAPLLVLLAGAGLEWLAPRLQGFLRKLPYAVTGGLALLFALRLARDARILPSANQCTPWPGVDCGRPANMYFAHDLALAMQSDWRQQGRRRKPRVVAGKPRADRMISDALGCQCDELIAPWLLALKARSPEQADYVVIWDSDYSDAEAGKLTARARQRFQRLGPELSLVRHRDRVVARLYRASP